MPRSCCEMPSHSENSVASTAMTNHRPHSALARSTRRARKKARISVPKPPVDHRAVRRIDGEQAAVSIIECIFVS